MDQLIQQLLDPAVPAGNTLRRRAAETIIALVNRLQSTAQPVYVIEPTLQEAVEEYRKIMNDDRN